MKRIYVRVGPSLVWLKASIKARQTDTYKEEKSDIVSRIIESVPDDLVIPGEIFDSLVSEIQAKDILREQIIEKVNWLNAHRPTLNSLGVKSEWLIASSLDNLTSGYSVWRQKNPGKYIVRISDPAYFPTLGKDPFRREIHYVTSQVA